MTNVNPTPPLTGAERDALELLARVYDAAVVRNATKFLPAWMKGYRAPSRTVHGVGREAEVFPADEATTSDVTVAQRRLVLRNALQVSHPKEVSASASTAGIRQLVGIYELAHDLGTQAFERLAKNWMLATLQQHARDQAQLLFRANAQRNSLQWAAKFVLAKVKVQLAERNTELDRVLFPRNPRRRDGDLEQRIDRVRYILAVAEVLKEALSSSGEKPPRLVRTEDSRGLSPGPLNRQTDRVTAPAPIPKDAALIAALQFLDRIKWHPRIEIIINAWHPEWSNGFRELAGAVGEALQANADLTRRLAEEPSRIWAFRAAIQQGISGVQLSGSRSVLQYALVYAPTVKTPLEEALEVIGVITTLLAAFGGPAAPVGVIADVVVQGGATALSFLRQIDQDDAEAATLFENVPDRLSEGGRYLAPIVQAAGVLAAAVAVPHAVKDILGAERAGARLPARFAELEPKLPSSAEVKLASAALEEQLALLAKEHGFQVPEYRDLHMTTQQAEVFANVNGRMLSSVKRAAPPGLSPLRTAQLVAAQDRAQSILDRLAQHWSAALPGRGNQKLTAEQAAKRLLDRLTSSPPTTGTVNSAVRDALYDNWRGRFIDSVKGDSTLVANLRDWAGIEFTPPGSKVTAFRVQAIDRGGVVQWVDLNWDHAFRHDDAVAQAIKTGDSSFLVPTVDPKNLAANLARENQVFKEGLIRHDDLLQKGKLPPRAPAGIDGATYESLGNF